MMENYAVADWEKEASDKVVEKCVKGKVIYKKIGIWRSFISGGFLLNVSENLRRTRLLWTTSSHPTNLTTLHSFSSNFPDTSQRLKSATDNIGFQCNSQMAQFTYCVYREYFLQCPLDRIKNKKCAKLRDEISNSKKSKV